MKHERYFNISFNSYYFLSTKFKPCKIERLRITRRNTKIKVIILTMNQSKFYGNTRN